MFHQHRGPWTVSDARALPMYKYSRCEIDDGVLLVSPPVSGARHHASSEMARLLSDAINTAPLRVVKAVDTITRHRTSWLKVPDVLVVQAAAADTDPAEYDAADVVLAVEISGSKQSRDRDFGEKLRAYAEVGIKDYWILELRPRPRLTAFALQDGAYEQISVSQSQIHLTSPFPVVVDPPQLLKRRPGGGGGRGG